MKRKEEGEWSGVIQVPLFEMAVFADTAHRLLSPVCIDAFWTRSVVRLQDSWMSDSQPKRLVSHDLSFDLSNRGDESGAARVRRLYCVGMAGAGVKAIAEWFSAAGWQVAGSDQLATDLLCRKFQDRGMRLNRGHSATYLSPKTNLLIYSPAIPSSNPERRAAEQLGIPQWSYPEALGQLMRGRDGVSIAGTHGKSTTTALVGHVLSESGNAPSILCGAEMVTRGLNGVYAAPSVSEYRESTQSSAGQTAQNFPIVVESCEYRGHFLELTPRIVGLLGIEEDHFDCFPTLSHAMETYRQFVERIPAAGTLVSNFDCAATRSVVQHAIARRVYVSSTDQRADYYIQSTESGMEGLQLTVRLPDRTTVRVLCPLWGRHHATNVVTALAMTSQYGVTPAQFAEFSRTFSGIRRRFERRLEWEGRLCVDDYAHHPTAVRAVIQAARDRFPARRIWCLFQPHQITRTRVLWREFAEALGRADGLLILPVFSARETTGTERVDLSRQLVEAIERSGTLAHFVPSLEHTWDTLQTHTRPGDVVLTVGAGDIDCIYHEFIGRLRRHHAS